MTARRITGEDAEFPDVLRNVKPPVTQLWVRGSPLASLAPFIAIVGSRHATAYGLEVARTFAAELADAGWCIVSGMAKGIDSAAHLGALDVGGRTVAVLGSGIDRPYPTSNRWLFEQIAGSGAVITEYAPGMPPLRHQFPARNRIIASLCDALVLVQARHHRSGAMGTATVALEGHATVFAVPGDIRSELSTGPHELLRHGAHAADSADVILRMLDDETDRAAARTNARIPGHLPEDQRAMLSAIDSGPARADDLSARAEIDIMRANRALARLELSGYIVRLDGGVYRRAQ